MTGTDRIRQGLKAIRPQAEPDERAFTSQWLSRAQRDAFAALPDHDRGHLVRVARALSNDPAASDDLIVAGLLHDIGKRDGVNHVRLVDRTVKVLLERVAPRFLRRLAGRHVLLPCFGGLRLAVHHPEIGSTRARELGCTDRTCWLIKNHDNPAIADPDLQRLIAIDRTTP